MVYDLIYHIIYMYVYLMLGDGNQIRDLSFLFNKFNSSIVLFHLLNVKGKQKGNQKPNLCATNK